MEESFQYFNDLRFKLMEDSQIKIAYAFRKWLKKRRMKEKAN